MKIVLLSGGSGKRLWPLSNEVRSKQFLKVVRDGDGRVESMLQRVHRQMQAAGLGDGVTVEYVLHGCDRCRAGGIHKGAAWGGGFHRG